MADQQHATMSLPMDLIRPALEAKINGAVLEALGQTDKLIMAVVERIMSQKVSKDGKVENYEGYNVMPWLTWAVEDITKKAIQEAIKAHIAMNAEKIKAAIDAEMRKSKSPLVQSLITAMAEGLAKSVSNHYSVSVQFKQGND